MQPALQITGLTKRYGRPAVNGLDLCVQSGELYALLGPNGAGKTTTLRMIAGLTDPDEGEIRVCGIDIRRDPIAAKRIIAWLPDEPLLYDRLTPLEYCEFVAGLWEIPADVARRRCGELLDLLGLAAHRDQRCGGFSRGMRQKLVLAGALLRDPKLMILDEPLTGLDAAAARFVKDLLHARVADGATIILTTHILEVAERMADRIGIIAQGRLVAEGTMASLRQKASSPSDRSLEDIFLEIMAENAAVADA